MSFLNKEMLPAFQQCPCCLFELVVNVYVCLICQLFTSLWSLSIKLCLEVHETDLMCGSYIVKSLIIQ